MTLELKKVVCGLTCLALLFCCQGIHCFNKQWQACQLALPRWIFRMHNIAPHLGVYIILYIKQQYSLIAPTPHHLCSVKVVWYCIVMLCYGGDCAIMVVIVQSCISVRSVDALEPSPHFHHATAHTQHIPFVTHFSLWKLCLHSRREAILGVWLCKTIITQVVSW